MGMLGEILGDAFDAEARGAWAVAYAAIAEVMKRAASGVTSVDVGELAIRSAEPVPVTCP